MTTPKEIDRLTICAIGVVAFLLTMIMHEAVAHGGAAVFLGGHVLKVTNWYCAFDGIESAFQGRLVAFAGITLNVVIGLAAIAVRRLLPGTFEPTHFFLWFFAHLNLFAAGSYMLIFSFLPFGDMHQALKDVAHSNVARIGSTLLGAVILYLTVRHCNSKVISFTGGESGWQQRHKIFTVLPYLVGASANVLAAVLGSDGNVPLVAILISAAGSSFGAGAMFFCGDPRPTDAPNSNVLTPYRSVPWIVLGVIALLIYYFLGKGFAFATRA